MKINVHSSWFCNVCFIIARSTNILVLVPYQYVHATKQILVCDIIIVDGHLALIAGKQSCCTLQIFTYTALQGSNDSQI